MRSSTQRLKPGSHGAFPIADSKQIGYLPSAVDEFLDRARMTYEDRVEAGSALTSKEIRRIGFPVKKHGYSARHVDAALDRLEEVFYDRERRENIASIGEDAWWAEIQQALSEVRGRLGRPKGKRFHRRSALSLGYRRSEVDAVLDRITRMLSGEDTISTSDIRNVVFHDEWRGYDEDQVDELLDTVIELILATG